MKNKKIWIVLAVVLVLIAAFIGIRKSDKFIPLGGKAEKTKGSAED